ncbi:MAG: hypothetical protein LBD23_18960 [Oscillospiraceae bacterium]|nr:hypothetical protein [Oscillospiraceae bacterium]
MKNKTTLTEQMLADYEKETDGEFIVIETSDPLIRIFNDNQIWFHWLSSNGYDKLKFYEYAGEYDKFRIKYDGDARYYNEFLGDSVAALRGDTIFSIYTPYKEMLKRSTGFEYHKCNNPFAELIAKRDESGYKEVNDFFYELAGIYSAPGNYMLLPHREMNAARYRCSQDRPDKSLYECFPSGNLAGYFGLDEETQQKNVAEWIRSQHLHYMFENNDIERNKIIPINKNNQYARFESMTDDELREYINYAVEFIKSRGEKLSFINEEGG